MVVVIFGLDGIVSGLSSWKSESGRGRYEVMRRKGCVLVDLW